MVDLAAVGVAGEDRQRLRGVAQELGGARRVGQHQARAARRAGQGPGRIGVPGDEVVHPDHRERHAAEPEHGVLVAEHRVAQPLERGGGAVGVDPVVVVAEHRHGGRRQAAERLPQEPHAMLVVGEVVAGERHQVRLEGVRRVEGRLDAGRRRPAADVDVGELRPPAGRRGPGRARGRAGSPPPRGPRRPRPRWRAPGSRSPHRRRAQRPRGGTRAGSVLAVWTARWKCRAARSRAWPGWAHGARLEATGQPRSTPAPSGSTAQRQETISCVTPRSVSWPLRLAGPPPARAPSLDGVVAPDPQPRRHLASSRVSRPPARRPPPPGRDAGRGPP